jgi:large subunit ribosomal protein L22
MAKTETNTQPVYRAEARMQRCSPQKAKLVLDLIKGKRVSAAIDTVMFTDKRIAPVVEGVLRSALQNAIYLSDERGLDLEVDNLVVKTAVANEGPRMKRLRPAPMGRAFRYQRRLTHIIITIAEQKEAEGGAENTTAAAAEGSQKKSARKSKAAGQPVAA